MTPKEKANKMVNAYMNAGYERVQFGFDYWEDVDKIDKRLAKRCALITVDEILKSLPKDENEPDLIFTNEETYWLEVKQEIEKL